MILAEKIRKGLKPAATRRISESRETSTPAARSEVLNAAWREIPAEKLGWDNTWAQGEPSGEHKAKRGKERGN